MVNAQEWLDKNYSKTRKGTTIVLDTKNKNLEGSLSLEEFTNLEKLDCQNNQLTNLDISGCPKIVKILCSNNQLTNANFLKQLKHPEKLISLTIDSNSLLEKDLTFLEPFPSLKELYLNGVDTECKEIREELKDCLKQKKGK